MLVSPESHAFQCPSCTRQYTIRRELVPAKGARIRCKKCESTIVVKLPETLRTSVWVLLGDPGVGRDEVQSTLRAEAMMVEVAFLDEAARRARLQALLAEEVSPPSVVVFGDMHVLLQDELLRLVTRNREVVRLRVTTHDNDGLTQAAQAFCGFDFQVGLPCSTGDVRATLRSAVTHNQTLHMIA